MAGHQRPLFVLFGASMTQFSFELGGWGAAFQDLYQRKADFLLRGYSGWNTRRALSVLPQLFPKDLSTQPALVVVFFGANDAGVPVPSGKGQAVPIEEFKGNLIKIATHLKGLSDSTRVILITAPPIHEEDRVKFLSVKYGEKKARKYPDRTNERAGQYSVACKAAAKEAGVGVVDLWTAIQQSTPDWGSCLTDGMHLSASGSRILLQELLNVLEKENWSPSLHWERMPIDFPQSSEYDYIHPSEESGEEASF